MSVQRKGPSKWVALVLFGDTVEELGVVAGDRVRFGAGVGPDCGIGSIRRFRNGFKLMSNTETSLRFGFSAERYGIRKLHRVTRVEHMGMRNGILYFQLPPWFPRNSRSETERGAP